jgi:hypothetical protein
MIDVNIPDIMGKDTDTIIMIVEIIVQTITEDIGVHGENGMIIEDTITTGTEMGNIIEKITTYILNLKMKMVALFFLLADN